jgi:hypothetical protein
MSRMVNHLVKDHLNIEIQRGRTSHESCQSPLETRIPIFVPHHDVSREVRNYRPSHGTWMGQWEKKSTSSIRRWSSEAIGEVIYSRIE